MNNQLDQYCINRSLIYYSVTSSLRAYIDHYIFFKFSKSYINNSYFHFFPSGNIEIYFHANNSEILIKDSNTVNKYKHFLIGLYDLERDLMIKPLTENSSYNCIRININLKDLIKFTNLPLKVFRNKIFRLSDIWGDKAVDLMDYIDNCSDINCIISKLNEFLLENIKQYADYKSKRLTLILDFCNRKQGILTVDEISKYLNLSYRTIHRIFTKQIDICPKDYLKIVRFNKVCHFLNKNSVIDWSDLVYSCGYYDQSHFIHDFKNITNCSPEKFMNQTGENSYRSSLFYF